MQRTNDKSPAACCTRYYTTIRVFASADKDFCRFFHHDVIFPRLFLLSCIFHASYFKVFELMKALFLFLGLVLAAFCASAQISVNVTMNQEQFLPGESVPVYVHITNRSGQTLHLGDDNEWLSFLVESDDGFMVIKKSDPPVIGPFDLGSSEVATKRVDLAPYFSLTRNGRYKVTATLHIKAWSTDVGSAPLGFDIIQGAELWSQVFGVPDPAVTNAPPRVRKYTLVEANYLRDQLRLYVQVTDAAGDSLKVRAIGPMISFGQPEAQLDPVSNLHILYQNGASTFTYAVVDPSGDITEREVYDYVSTRPRLRQDDNGNISVYGGVRRVEMPPVEAPDALPR
jgi:hypothetical protein